MEKQVLINKLPALIRQRNIIAILAMIMICANLLLSMKLIGKDETIVILPSKVSGKYELTNNKVNDVYLRDRANEIIRVILNITQNNLEQMYEAILRTAPPSNHFALKTELTKLGKEIMKRNVSIAFFPTSTTVDVTNLTARIEGEFYSLFGGSTSKSIRNYHLGFTYTGNQLSLVEFFEITTEEEEKDAK